MREEKGITPFRETDIWKTVVTSVDDTGVFFVNVDSGPENSFFNGF